MLTETVTLHYGDGRIAWQVAKRRIDGQKGEESYLGTMPWNWIAPQFHEAVKTAIARALIGHPLGPIRYELDTSKFPGMGWIVETNWLPIPCTETPIIGISTAWSAVVENLSAREREIAKLLPDYNAKQIARILKISASTVETHRGRIGIKIGFSGGQLVAWCQAHRDVL